MTNIAGNNKYLKELNKTKLLNLIRIYKSISKSDLSKITGLSSTAAGSIVSSLIEMGFVRETGIGESKGGRRPILLELNPDSFFSIGVDIDVVNTKIILVDIKGNIVYENLLAMSDYKSFENVVILIEEAIVKLLDFLSIRSEKVLGIGISVPGLVNNDTSEIILAPNLCWEHKRIEFKNPKVANMQVYFENEARASAICENWTGICQGIDDFICINIKSGIGAGIFTSGKLYRGSSSSAGEVGHIVVDENGPKCGCGNYGCLETLSSTTSIVENTKKLLRQGIVSSLNDYNDIETIDLDKIIKAAYIKNDAARQVLLESSRYLGIAISNIINTLNPAVIVLGKEFVKYSDIVLNNVKSIVSTKALKSPTAAVEIVSSEIGENSSALGAAIIPLKVLFGK